MVRPQKVEGEDLLASNVKVVFLYSSPEIWELRILKPAKYPPKIMGSLSKLSFNFVLMMGVAIP